MRATCLAVAFIGRHIPAEETHMARKRATTATFDDAAFSRDEETVRTGFWSKARAVAARLPFAEDLLAAYYCAFDRDTPLQVKAALIGALAYFVLPADAMPDVLPVLGFADDAAVLATALRIVAGHITPKHRDAARRAMENGL